MCSQLSMHIEQWDRDSLDGQESNWKPGAILMQVRVPNVARDFSPRVNFQCKLSYNACIAPVCNCLQ